MKKKKKRKNIQEERAFQLYARYYYSSVRKKLSRKALSRLYVQPPFNRMSRDEIIQSEEYKKIYEDLLSENEFAAAYRAGHPEQSPAFVNDYLEKAPILRNITGNRQQISPERMMERYKELQRQAEVLSRRETLRRNILDRIPDSLPDLYPAARAMERHFILHVGPTNSGKTYDAIEAMKNADTGIYLGPLRLLAYEQYEKLNREDIPCNLVTGEEESYVEYARHRASTVEMLPLDENYDCAVIDEAQMVGDSERGGAWTAAILGVLSPEVHVCLAPEAEECVIRLIEDCKDTYEIRRHERKTPLLCDERRFSFPKSVEKGDALIVFSRRDVHSVASVLQGRGVRCSLIYGNLPHDVRHTQANSFMRGDADVVVATDAIGMGMNLPIRRVVFLEDTKFDGKEERPLFNHEIRQIAGRAGRYGIHEEGLYNSIYSARKLEEAINAEPHKIRKAYVDFPESLKYVGESLSETMKQWDNVPVSDGYEKGNIKRDIALAEKAEKYTDDRDLIYRFATIPFDEKDASLMMMWHDMLISRVNDVPYVYPRIRVNNWAEDVSEALGILEHQYKVCDMLFYYKKRFEPERFGWIEEKKGEISGKIIALLAQQKLSPRRCIQCGRKLPWNHKYKICDKCFNMRNGIW